MSCFLNVSLSNSKVSGTTKCQARRFGCPHWHAFFVYNYTWLLRIVLCLLCFILYWLAFISLVSKSHSKYSMLGIAKYCVSRIWRFLTMSYHISSSQLVIWKSDILIKKLRNLDKSKRLCTTVYWCTTNII